MNRRLLLLAAMAAAPLLAHAQELPPGTTVSSAALTGIAQFDSNLDAGGSFRWAGGIASGSVLHQFTRQFAAGFSLRYDFQQYRFSNPTAFGGVAPWGDINQPQIGATFIYAAAEDWTVVVSPSVGWAYENGARTGDALNYGAVAIATRGFSPTLSLGVGAAVFRQINETRTFPFLAIDWQIDDRWKLANPFPAGPTGGAGLELSYAFAEGWEAGFGGTYRSFAFRLDQAGPVPGGIGETTSIPVFIRLSRNMGPRSQFDFHAVALANGRLRVKNPEGNDLASDNYRIAPALALTFRHRF
jgi:hypothetical protein